MLELQPGDKQNNGLQGVPIWGNDGVGIGNSTLPWTACCSRPRLVHYSPIGVTSRWQLSLTYLNTYY